jgi:four helix bundle protein
MRNFRDYDVWQKAIDVAVKIYDICDMFPKYEVFALGDQLRRAAVSISSNIAEGSSRSSNAEFIHYLEISIGSAFEVETQLLIARKRNYIAEEAYENLMAELQLLERQINSFILKLRQSPTPKGQKPKAHNL